MMVESDVCGNCLVESYVFMWILIGGELFGLGILKIGGYTVFGMFGVNADWCGKSKILPSSVDASVEGPSDA